MMAGKDKVTRTDNNKNKLFQTPKMGTKDQSK